MEQSNQSDEKDSAVGQYLIVDFALLVGLATACFFVDANGCLFWLEEDASLFLAAAILFAGVAVNIAVVCLDRSKWLVVMVAMLAYLMLGVPIVNEMVLYIRRW